MFGVPVPEKGIHTDWPWLLSDQTPSLPLKEHCQDNKKQKVTLLVYSCPLWSDCTWISHAQNAKEEILTEIQRGRELNNFPPTPLAHMILLRSQTERKQILKRGNGQKCVHMFLLPHSGMEKRCTFITNLRYICRGGRREKCSRDPPNLTSLDSYPHYFFLRLFIPGRRCDQRLFRNCVPHVQNCESLLTQVTSARTECPLWTGLYTARC